MTIKNYGPVPFGASVASRQDSTIIPFRIMGENNNIDDAKIVLWEVGGAYAFPSASGQQMEVISDSADDDGNPVGTGARTVHIVYLDVNLDMQTETLTLNGKTAVATTATNIRRVLDFHVVTVGSGGQNAGIIDLRHLDDTPVYSRILAGENSAHTAVYSIPDGYTGYIVCANFGASASVSGHATRFYLEVTADHEGDLQAGVFMPKHVSHIQDGHQEISFGIPIKCPGQSDIRVRVISDNAAANVYGTAFICGWLEVN